MSNERMTEARLNEIEEFFKEDDKETVDFRGSCIKEAGELIAEIRSCHNEIEKLKDPVHNINVKKLMDEFIKKDVDLPKTLIVVNQEPLFMIVDAVWLLKEQNEKLKEIVEVRDILIKRVYKAIWNKIDDDSRIEEIIKTEIENIKKEKAKKG